VGEVLGVLNQFVEQLEVSHEENIKADKLERKRKEREAKKAAIAKKN
jgi:hypothetical protein